MSNLEERSAKAAELLASRRYGAISTLSKRRPGYPFASVVNYGLDGAGRPTFLFSGLATHMKNLVDDPRASFLVVGVGADDNPLLGSRLTMIGDVEEVPEEDLAATRTAYLEKHPDAVDYLELGDFTFYRLSVLESYFVGGFGEMGWIPGR